MNAREWLECCDPLQMMQMLEVRAVSQKSEAFRRQLLLFGTACCRSVEPLLDSSELSQIIDTVEQVADDLFNGSLVEQTFKTAGVLWNPQPSCRIRSAIWFLADAYTDRISYFNSTINAISHVLSFSRETAGWDLREAFCELLRDIFGNPFAKYKVKPFGKKCQLADARAVAADIYTSGHFQELPILADALEDAGSVNKEILDHLRSPGPHVKGCWALDLVLGRRRKWTKI